MARSATSAVDKALDLIEAVARSDRPLRLTELADRVSMHRATAYRVLVDLIRRGWVLRHGDNYLPGTAVLQLSRSAAAGSLVALCHPVLVELAERTGMMTNLQVLEADGARILDVVRPPRYALIAELTGELLPVHRFAGPLALVAALDDPRTTHYLRLATDDGFPLDGPDGLHAEIAATRRRGRAVVRRRAQAVIASVSEVIFSGDGLPLCAITVVGLDSEFDDPTLHRVEVELAAAVAQLQAELGAGREAGQAGGDE